MESSTESEEEVLLPYDPESSLVSADSFYYPSNLFTNSIISTILGHNFEKARELITSGRELNLTDNLGRTALHAAVQVNNLEIVEVLLKQPSININTRTHLGETPLLFALRWKSDNEIIIKLIENGCDFNIPNLENVTPLSLAVIRNDITIAHLLIKMGADIDAKDFDGYTPLHEAVNASCYEAVCMLLYYNASVNEVDFTSNITPFMLAMNSRAESQIAKVLFDYVTDFNVTDYDGHSLLFSSLSCRCQLSKDILLQIEDINNITDINTCLRESLNLKDVSIFKYILSKINHADLIGECEHFLEYYIRYCIFSLNEYVECLHLLLTSESSLKFINGCCTFLPLIQKMFNTELTEDLRISTLYLLFASGMEITYYEFWHIYKYFGFNKELETVFVTQPRIQKFLFDTTTFMCTENFINIAWNIFHSYNGVIDMAQVPKIIENNFPDILIDFLKFYTFNRSCQGNVISNIDVLLCVNFSEVVKKLNERNIASLRELCRNKIRHSIISNISATGNMYTVYDAIKSLPVPKMIQDILHLKRPLYA